MAITSKRQGAVRSLPRAASHARAMRARRNRFRAWTVSSGWPQRRLDRVRTSTKTVVSPSRAIRSISPSRDLHLVSRIR